MKSYANLPLRSDEEVIEEFGVSDKYTYLLIAVGVVLLIAGLIVLFNSQGIPTVAGSGVLAPLLLVVVWAGFLLIGVYLIGVGVYLQLAYKFFLTNQRVIESVGFIAQRAVSADYQNINEITIRQDIINRLFLGTGTLGISTPGTAGEEFRLVNIDRPLQRRELLRGLIRAAIDGQPIDKFYLAHLKAEMGLATSDAEALEQIEESTGVEHDHAVADAARLAVHAQEHQELGAARPPEAMVPAPKPTPPATPPEVTEQGSQLPVTRPEQPSPPVPANESTLSTDVEDLHGDGIDESDRLRAAQKRIDDSAR